MCESSRYVSFLFIINILLEQLWVTSELYKKFIDYSVKYYPWKRVSSSLRFSLTFKHRRHTRSQTIRNTNIKKRNTSILLQSTQEIRASNTDTNNNSKGLENKRNIHSLNNTIHTTKGSRNIKGKGRKSRIQDKNTSILGNTAKT